MFIFLCPVNQPVSQDTSMHHQTTIHPLTQKQHLEVSETGGRIDESSPDAKQSAQQSSRITDANKRGSSRSSRRKRYETDRI